MCSNQSADQESSQRLPSISNVETAPGSIGTSETTPNQIRTSETTPGPILTSILNQRMRNQNLIQIKKRRQEEYSISRQCGWFSIRYFSQSTDPSGDNVRYIFVNSNKYGIVWPNVVFFLLMHACFFYAMALVFINCWLEPWVASYCVGVWSGIGISAGAHRLWSHKAYKAHFLVRMLLMILFTSAGQNDLYTWCRDHRLHHKFTETDADPHNSRRGAFFAHVGWLLTKKHPDVILKGSSINNSDLLRDPVVSFNKKYYPLLYLIFRVYVPALIPNLM